MILGNEYVLASFLPSLVNCLSLSLSQDYETRNMDLEISRDQVYNSIQKTVIAPNPALFSCFLLAPVEFLDFFRSRTVMFV